MNSPVVPEPPQFPVGPFAPDCTQDTRRREGWIDDLDRAPARLSQLVSGLPADQLDTRYRNWSIRQIVHHLADAHLNSYARFKLALTEEHPTIKPYDESQWSLLADAQRLDIAPSLQMLTGLHARWIYLLRSLEPSAFERSFYHPANKEVMPLWRALAYYAWHARHHTAQIEWVKKHRLSPLRDR
jgi:uncharacterized damage-inducible protein DinB